MPATARRHKHAKTGLPTLSPGYQPPDPNPVTPANANVTEVLVLVSGALVIVFDREVILDTLNPPTTWTLGDNTFILPGSLNFGTSCYIPPNSGIGPGDPIIIRANDPGARTPDGGYVNAVTTVVSSL
jgi:hypothetical protein